MIEPPGGIPSLRAINYAAIVQPEIESVAVLSDGPCTVTLCTPPRDQLSFVLEYHCPGLDIGDREDTATMHGGTANGDTAHNGMFEMAMKRADSRTGAASP